MKTSFLVGFAIASSLFLGSCASTTDGLKAFHEFEKDLKSRGCGSGGDITLKGATLTSLPDLSGHYEWDCPKAEPKSNSQ